MEVEELKKKDCNQHQAVGKWISVLYRQFQIYINHKLQDLNISSSEYIFLLVLYKQDGISQETLSSTLYINKAATTRALKSLEEKGFIKRIKNDVDKRVNQVYVTEQGKQLREALYSVLEQWNTLMTDGIGTKTVDLVIDTLQEMSESVTRKPV